MKRAIVLSGGGTKGAYELGVWRALRELSIDYQIVTGTSIGSINGALMAVDDYEHCEEMWANLQMEDMMVDGITVTNTMEDFYNQKQGLLPFLKKYMKNKGIDNSPFTEFIEKNLDEDRIRKSPIDYGLVTVRFPSLEPFMHSKKDIPRGLLKDFVIASSSVFPAFPMHKIGDEVYLDGCYHDNLPIDLAVEMGAEEIIAVDLHTTPQHPNYMKRPYVKTILPSHDLGGILDFSSELKKRNIQLGYWDGLKAYGRLKGFKYYFTPESIEAYRDEIYRFCRLVAIGESLVMRQKNGKMAKAGDIYRMFHLFEEAADGRTPEREDYFICAAEICGEIFGLEQEKVYDMSDFIKEIFSKQADKEHYPDAVLFAEDASRNLLKRLADLKLKSDSMYLAGCLYYASKDGIINYDEQMSVLAYLPNEMAASLFMHAVQRKSS